MSTRRISHLARNVAGFACLVLLLSSCLSSSQATNRDLLNQDRRDHSLASLRERSDLSKKAQAWAEHLASKNALSHSDLSAGTPSCWRSLGENVGYGTSVAQVEDAYMNSAPHRANILNKSYTTVGVGVARRGDRVFTVQEFMSGC